jgi:hypothetical protein
VAKIAALALAAHGAPDDRLDGEFIALLKAIRFKKVASA